MQSGRNQNNQEPYNLKYIFIVNILFLNIIYYITAFFLSSCLQMAYVHYLLKSYQQAEAASKKRSIQIVYGIKLKE